VESPGVAAASASPGEINRYAMAVRAVLARGKPRGMRDKGTLVIVFTIEGSGKIDQGHREQRPLFARRSTVEAVEKTAFPKPPANMSPRQRIYVVPFRLSD
jgi:hypothetical protein